MHPNPTEPQRVIRGAHIVTMDSSRPNTAPDTS